MKRLNRIITTAGASLLLLGSCKKDNNNNNVVHDNLIGSWKAVTDARDSNNNGIIDAGETTPDAMFVNYLWVFKSDGTLSYMEYGTILAGQWSWQLVANNSYLKTTDAGAAGTVIYKHIDNISSTSLTLKDTSGGVTTWVTFQKQ